jgi:UDP-N-acetyl-D-glucosamine dehydrogenase
LFARNLLYLVVFARSALWPAGILLIAQRPQSVVYSQNRNFVDPAGPGSQMTRSTTELMPLDRKPEFFKGAQLKVAIIGCGYVGLPLALRFAEAGHKVTGFDTDPNKVSMLNAGKSYIEHIPQNKIQQFVNSRHFSATTDFAKLKEADAIIICVPTPLDERREPDLSYVEQTAISIYPHLQRGQLVVLESTTYPGTTEELVLPILEKSGLRCPIAAGSENENIACDFYLAFSPEREDPGNKQFGLAQIPKVVGGLNPPSGRAAQSLYTQVVARVVPVSSTRAAEMAKLLENIFRCVNIALVNELKMLSLRMNIDIWEVIDAAATKPFGFMPFYPGPGLGGHCIPVDPYYLSWKAREYDFATRFIELAGEVNTAMPYHVVGVAYKKDVDDLRESPTLKIMQLLQQRGALLDYNDPYFPQLHKMRHYNYENMKSVPLNPQTLGSYDAVIIATDHSSYDYVAIVDAAKLVIDTRNATRRVIRHRNKIVLC